MMSIHSVLLISMLAASTQIADIPEAWTRKIEAAANAKKSGHYALAEALLTEVVREAEIAGELIRAQLKVDESHSSRHRPTSAGEAWVAGGISVR
jgi:hypothetical protein